MRRPVFNKHPIYLCSYATAVKVKVSYRPILMWTVECYDLSFLDESVTQLTQDQ